MKKLLPLAAIAAVVYYFSRQPADFPPATVESAPAAVESRGTTSPDAIAEAYKNQRSDIQVAGEGRVARILGDDSEGGRHQRFILTLGSGQTLLVAHNIDVAPRLDSLQVGDSVEFNGEYEWNDKGGVLHWTHHDPQGQHEDGWLKHRGRTYQ